MPNSNVNEFPQKLSDGSTTSSSAEYVCHQGYYIDNESNSNFDCTADGSWSPKQLPVCLKGYMTYLLQLLLSGYNNINFLGNFFNKIVLKISLKYFFVECDGLPTVDNSNTPTSTNENMRDGVILNGTSFKFECHEHYVQSHKEITCGVDGKWTPLIECVPSKITISLKF